ncbi:MAG TPA: MarR family winged helix-turn-helix transcriptional regulator [Burkholderiales bacterium]
MPRRAAGLRREAPAASVPPLPCTGATIRRLARRITSFYESRMPGLRLGQYSLLAHLGTEPQPLCALSRRLEMDRTTLTRNLKPLLAAGWVRETAGADARLRLVALTPAGRRVRERARTHWKTAQAELEETLGRDFVPVLHAHLDAALARLKPALPDDN